MIVSASAALQRVRRALHGRGQTLRIARGAQVLPLGPLFVVTSAGIRRKNLTLAQLVEELKVLEPWETLGR